MNKRLDEELERFMRRGLEEQYPYVILDARYERVRQEGVIRSRAVLVAIGVDWEGRRQILGVELANRESSSSWKEVSRAGACAEYSLSSATIIQDCEALLLRSYRKLFGSVVMCIFCVTPWIICPAKLTTIV
jgi:hypothetical protein